ncbi:hypothetical protein ACFFX0_15635 [Citricoccus parietis]|uniref:Uncharacterized protein n=1 Tax=Citricoccus parietis TaxID=592307 RepID=A0ABV5G0W6_9MICC
MRPGPRPTRHHTLSWSGPFLSNPARPPAVQEMVSEHAQRRSAARDASSR